MPRRTKQQIAAENAAHRAYLQVFSNCAVPMWELPTLLNIGVTAALKGLPHGGVCTAMAAYADLHGYPHNDPGETLASIVDRGMRAAPADEGKWNVSYGSIPLGKVNVND